MQELVQALSHAERAVVRRLSPRSRPRAAPCAQWRVLLLLADGRGHPMSEIAEFALVPAPSLTRLVDRMVTDGLVHRRADARDRRRTLVHLTPRGRALHRRLDARRAARAGRGAGGGGPGRRPGACSTCSARSPAACADGVRAGALRPTAILAGGAAGTLARAGVNELLPHDPGAWPWATLLVNLAGTFILAAATGWLATVARPAAYWQPLLGRRLLRRADHVLGVPDRDHPARAARRAGARARRTRR